MKGKDYQWFLCLVALLGLGLAACNSSGQSEQVTMSKATLLDKIKGGWAGQVIGCTYGGPTEFRWNGQMIPDSCQIVWDDTRATYYFDNFPGLYDDVYMDLTFVKVFEEKGLDAPIDAFAQAFAHAGYPLWHANQSARYNILQGVPGTESGYWKNNPHCDDLDFQIEADYAGLMSPGMPNTAVHYSDAIGHLMCYGDGWYGGVYVAAMYALAFVSDDIQYVVTEGLKAIPAQSDFHRCMQFVIDTYQDNPTDWKKSWQLIEDSWSKAENCPDGIDSPFNIDTKINCAYILIGLLYGKGDYTQTIEIATRCGQDSDCNPASAAGILGTMIGYERIPDEWKACLPAIADREFAHVDVTLNQTYEMGLRQALQVIEQNGGKVENEQVTITKQEVSPTRFEKSFEGMHPMRKIPMDNRSIDQVCEIRFEGCGIVVMGTVKAEDPAYVAEVGVYKDGQLLKTMRLPAAEHDRGNDLYWNYELPESEHQLSFKHLNPKDRVVVHVSNYVVYSRD
ncbi:MAG: ADP-ribosylglycohydrolase family protein [Parabacteroides sp.]